MLGNLVHEAPFRGTFYAQHSYPLLLEYPLWQENPTFISPI